MLRSQPISTRLCNPHFLKAVLLCFGLSFSLTGHSQGFGDLLRGAVSKIAGPNAADALQGMMVNGISSLTGVDVGKVAAGAPSADPQGRVVLFRTAWCGYCKQAAAYMSQKGIPFVERDIEAVPANRTAYQTYGGKGVPLMVMGDKTMSGFSPSSFDQAYAVFKASQPVANAAVATPASAANTDTSARTVSAAGAAVAADAAAIQAGDALVSKLKSMPIYAQPNKTAPLLTNLSATDQAIYLGEERNGLYRLGTPAGDGWGDKLMLKRAQ